MLSVSGEPCYVGISTGLQNNTHYSQYLLLTLDQCCLLRTSKNMFVVKLTGMKRAPMRRSPKVQIQILIFSTCWVRTSLNILGLELDQ